MTLEEFFLCSVDDLESRMSNPTEYNIVRSAAIIRQMFVDSLSTAPNMAKAVGVKLEFHPHADLIGLPHTKWKAAIALHQPESNAIRPAVNEMPLLSIVCLVIDSREFSIREIIKFCSNVQGGVHWGSARGDDQLLIDLNAAAGVSGTVSSEILDISMTLLTQIARVILDGLRPVVAEMRK